MKALRVAALALIGTLAVATPARTDAQQYSPLALGVDVSALRLARDVATTQLLAGQVLGVHASASFKRFEIEGHYAEGALTPEGLAAGEPEDLVEASLLARVRLLNWLAVGGGPHLRAFVTPSGTARWSRVEANARFDGELIAGVAQLRIDAWYAVGTEVNVQGGGDGALGGEVGLTIRIPRTPTSLQVSYLADRASFTNGGAEFVEGLRVALMLDRIGPARRTTR